MKEGYQASLDSIRLDHDKALLHFCGPALRYASGLQLCSVQCVVVDAETAVEAGGGVKGVLQVQLQLVSPNPNTLPLEYYISNYLFTDEFKSIVS